MIVSVIHVLLVRAVTRLFSPIKSHLDIAGVFKNLDAGINPSNLLHGETLAVLRVQARLWRGGQ
jgi:hypothetical protein